MKITLRGADKIRVNSSQDTYEIIKKVFYEKSRTFNTSQEHFWTIALNSGEGILNIELISLGTRGRTVIDPPLLFRLPLYKSAHGLVLVHNHPSGSLSPSNPDIDLTNKLIKCGMLLNIEIFDHVIVTEKSYFSFKDNGFIDELKRDPKYLFTFMMEKQIKEDMEKLKRRVAAEKEIIAQQSLEEGKKERNSEIAKQMLLDGKALQEIERYTMLPLRTLERIRKECERK